MPAIRRTAVVLSILALAACAASPPRSAAGSTAGPSPTAARPPSAAASPAAAARTLPTPAADGASASVDPAPSADPRITRAAALAGRVLGDPTPQQVAVQTGAVAVAFDREAYLDNPAAYLDGIDSLRAVSPAQPAAGVAAIEAVDGTGFRVRTGASVRIRVRSEPGFPVSFATTGLGTFASGYDAISVAADATGLAEAVFIATRGTNAQVPIHVASPVRSGVLNILVQVE